LAFGIDESAEKINFNFDNKLILEIGAGDALNFEYLTNQFNIRKENYEILELDYKSVETAKKEE
jgi:hypothetical protein